MQQSARTDCPKCSRPLQKFNGHIGYCQQHKWVSPLGLGFDAEAAEQNRLDEEAENKRRLEAERAKAEATDAARRVQHASAVRKAIVVAVALVLVAAAVVYFVVRPSMNYNHAADLASAGDYAAAREAYSALGDYKDAKANVVLCDAMIDLQENRTEDAAAKLDQLTGEGHGDAANQLAKALLPVMASWKAKGLTPQALLLLLGKADVIDPDKTLDRARLNEEAHMALLDGTQLAVCTEDVDGDGQPELVTLNPDYTVTVYRMAADGNARLAVDNSVASTCAAAFGSRYRDTDLDAAVACFAEAFRLQPDDGTRASLTEAYQARSAASENAGDIDAAIADARSAMETAGSADAFTFFYDISLRHCRNGRDAATAIAMWEEFAAGAAPELARYNAKNRWQADAAQLHIARAGELAVRKDEACMDEIRTAYGMGADVTDAVADALAQFEPGLTLARLRLMEIDLLGADSAVEQQIRAGMADEVRTAIAEWDARGIAPEDVPVLIRLADEQGISLEGIDRDAVYEAAAVAAAGKITQYSFVNWDQDAYRELLALDAGGILRLYGLDGTWKILSEADTRLPGSSYVIADEAAPLILVLAKEKDEFLAMTGTGTQLSALFREQGICRYKAEGTLVTFSRLLEGSIARYNDYAYEASGTASRPVRTGMDWQENDYPQPEDAAAAVQRYFEARAYDIPGEVAVLTGTAGEKSIFDADALSALPAPEIPGRVDAAAYLTEDRRELFEVAYTAGTAKVRAWIAVEYADGWKLVGAADTYGPGLSAVGMDYTVALISLNAETAGKLAAKGSRHTCRVLVPAAGRISLVWQSGGKAASRVSHTVTMYRGSLTGETVFAYQLQPSPNKQQSKDMFVSAGVYYVTVEAGFADTDPYRMDITFSPETHIELENNDTAARATQVELNTAYSGTLSGTNDVDYYAFTLEKTSAVNVTFGTSGSASKAATYAFTVLGAADGRPLCAVSVPGNAQLAETGNLYLSAGAYLVQVAKGSSFTSDEYILTVTASVNGQTEAEPNNTAETANPVPLNEDIHASFGQEGDIDCYTFTLEADAVVQTRFTFTPTDSNSRTYVLTVSDMNRRELLKVNIGGKESTKVITPVALAAGTYAVKIENPRFIRQDYTLRLVSMPVAAAEKEPNDSAALATALAVGQPRTGVLTSDADSDYYKLTFTDQAAVTLRFSFPQSTSTNSVFVLSIEQNGKTQWTVSIKGDSGGIEQQLLFPAGEYYIRIKPSTWLGAVYTLAIE